MNNQVINSNLFTYIFTLFRERCKLGKIYLIYKKTWWELVKVMIKEISFEVLKQFLKTRYVDVNKLQKELENGKPKPNTHRIYGCKSELSKIWKEISEGERFWTRTE